MPGPVRLLKAMQVASGLSLPESMAITLTTGEGAGETT